MSKRSLEDEDRVVERKRSILSRQRLNPDPMSRFVHYFYLQSFSKYKTLLKMMNVSKRTAGPINKLLNNCNLNICGNMVRFYDAKRINLLFTLCLTDAVHLLAHSYFAIRDVVMLRSAEPHYLESRCQRISPDGERVNLISRVLELIGCVNIFYTESPNIMNGLRNALKIDNLIIQNKMSFAKQLLYATESTNNEFLEVGGLSLLVKEPQTYSVLDCLPNGQLIKRSLKRLKINLSIVSHNALPMGSISRLVDNYTSLQTFSLLIKIPADTDDDQTHYIRPLFNELNYFVYNGIHVNVVVNVTVSKNTANQNDLLDSIMVNIKPHFIVGVEYTTHKCIDDSIYYNVNTKLIKAHICVSCTSCPLLAHEEWI
ncbi:unnamed protein product [Bursaphelenchus okinawaensis]|uniref:Uncharacterized protein n=1 Tax=Bursaphelenchus okinawaensis TaxID=465554 RepID=A0A811K556_9BILA|nr:unnamed protein product [Bursaphelenchus okinawaensis]CAG9091450.1 unnamed protein product [Bursaphelenchus okinawaensis]